MYAQKVGRSGRDGDEAVCTLSFNSADLESLRRAAARGAVSLHETCVIFKEVAVDTATSGVAFVSADTFLGCGVVAVRIPPALEFLASASLFSVGTQTRKHGNVVRRPAWHSPSISLSADAAYFLCTVLFPS